ncbi:hypothetical protein [Cutibacterium modestum]|uniref:hypothetical protein n=1 Tax=Cutibacterium modestum TaxID=2559073 RepID=UPI000F0683AA|nr:hypothetical protein [Cutibacterium modestum]
MTNTTSQVQDELWCRHDGQASGLMHRPRLPPLIYGKAGQQVLHCHPCNQILPDSHTNLATGPARGGKRWTNDRAASADPLDSP